MALKTACAAISVCFAVVIATASSASASTVTGQGIVTGHKSRAGGASHGDVGYAAGVQVNRDDAGVIINVRATGNVSKLRKVSKVQVDRIALGTATGLVSENTKPANSGSKGAVISRTGWRSVAIGTCTNYRARVSYSVRWSDGALSKFSVLSPLTKVCGGAAWSKGPDSVGGAPAPAFPAHLAGWRLIRSWDSRQNAFSFGWTPAAGSSGERFPSTMNGCDENRFLVRWRALNSGVTMDARFMDASGGMHATIASTSGWMDLDGCETPIFHLHSSNPNEVASMAVSVQHYLATA